MNYLSYRRTLDEANAKEELKKPGQRFCDQVGWKLNEKYDEIQRPDKITWCGGTMYRTITPTTHVWYRNKRSRENIWIEFSGNSIIVKKGINVTTSEGCSFNSVCYHPNPNVYQDIKYFFDNDSVCSYLLRI